MAIHRQTLIDTTHDIGLDHFSFSSKDVSGSSGNWSVTGRRLRGGLREGVEYVELDNGHLKVAVVPTRGMGIWKAWQNGLSLGWKSPVMGPVHPSLVNLAEPSGLGWLDGFDELVARCGLAYCGAPDFDERGQLLYSLHGRIANTPAHFVELIVDDTAGTLSLRGVVEEARFHFQTLRLTTTITLPFDSPAIEWQDTVLNFGGKATDMQMLYHINIGPPLLGAGTEFFAPIAEVAPRTVGFSGGDWPRDPGPMPGSSERCYYFDLLADKGDETEVLLQNATAQQGVSLRLNKRALPRFTVWRNTPHEASGYVTGIEPGTSFAEPHRFEKEQGRVVPLAPGESWEGKVRLDWMLDPAEIKQSRERIASIQGDTLPIIHEEPRADWSKL